MVAEQIGHRTSLGRYIAVVTASILIMLCAGAVYAWSIFVAPLKTEFGFSTVQTQLVYGLIIGIFTLAMLFVNKILRKYGPRVSAAIGAVLFFAGYMVASFSQGNLWMIILGMSLLSGIGMAFGYVTVLNNLVKWFPRHKGLATGLAVSGFGGGAILLSQIARPLLANGWDVMDIFRVVGIIYGVLFLAGSLVLSVPAWYQAKPEDARVNLHKNAQRTGVSGCSFMSFLPGLLPACFSTATSNQSASLTASAPTQQLSRSACFRSATPPAGSSGAWCMTGLAGKRP